MFFFIFINISVSSLIRQTRIYSAYVRLCACVCVSASSSSFEVPPHDVTAAPERPALEAALCFFFSPPASFYFEIPFDTQAARFQNKTFNYCKLIPFGFVLVSK